MNYFNKILLAVSFLFLGEWAQAYSADHLILQDLDTQNNLAIICQADGSLCSDVEVVSFDDLDSYEKDQVVEMIESSTMDEYSNSSTLELAQFKNFLSHSDKISYSSKTLSLGHTGLAIMAVSALAYAPSFFLKYHTKHGKLFERLAGGSAFVFVVGGSLVLFSTALMLMDNKIEINL